ncbi:type IV toxin-antitoxin system AbiEi family antitoxin domain-containing protein [Metallumcola ferriviriculae]|uniref:Type IV toxin-antitoxin system AbiEi family antitoxin domain-containing protein n=1 Tax=Metallumcola ferriviriculae TaxID=3039180 RepID=A0AAU0UIS2_9FIRM|nr:type IV toxin-antitoxin system AbiEi family antitoxin domain-containing protein [Desulfitibacteraceae bacterium MK1]
MIIIEKIKKEFRQHGGVLKTSELNAMGLSSRQIKKLLEDDVLSRIKCGFYELTDEMPQEEVIIARLFPQAVIFLESALMHYGYTDRIPLALQIAVDKNSKKNQYDINYPAIEPYYLLPKFIEVGVGTMEVEGVKVRIYNRDRTICDVLRYENKLEKEVFSCAIRRYARDTKKNVRRLFEYAEIFNIKKKVQTYVGVWL